jgi:putative endonuclease
MWVYYVYMLRCFDGTLYVGMTNNINKRYDQHCNGDVKTCYTYTRRPLRLVYAEEFSQVNDAISWEKRLKQWTHKKKRAFAERDWPLLKQLSAGTDDQMVKSRRSLDSARDHVDHSKRQ